MKILLTGVTGQVGSQLEKILRKYGQVVATSTQGCRKSIPMDLASPDSIQQVVNKIRPQLIVNPAAYTAVDKAEEDTQVAEAINSAAPAILAEEAKNLGAGLIHFSTDYVYDGNGNMPFTEESPTAPVNSYGKTKLAGDEAIVKTNCPHWILRTSWVWGSHGNNFVKTMLKLGRSKEELNIINDQVGAPTSAATLAHIVDKMLEKAGPQFIDFMSDTSGIYHVVNSGETTWHGFAKEIFKQAHIKGFHLKVDKIGAITTDQYPTPAARPLNSRLSLSKLEETFQITPESWQEALATGMEPLLKSLT